MTSTPIEPGSILGVLGGGQLGAMFAAAAARLGFHIAVWDPDQDAPAHRLAAHSFVTPFDDDRTREEFSRLVRVVTYEWENVPAELCQALERRVPVRPSSAILRVIQNRLTQKQFLAGQGFPVPHFAPLTDPAQLGPCVSALGFPALCKTATAGYDGKGQWRIGCAADIPAVQRLLRLSAPSVSEWIVEALVAFEREISILVVRGIDGQCVVYPPVENEHEDGILRTTVAPAEVPSAVADRARELGHAVVESLKGIGVFCLELFQLPDGHLLINEVAPRPHNSGHYTLDACRVSQFEQQARAITGLPLGDTRLRSSAAMVNLIGSEVTTVQSAPECRALLALPGSHLHLYGKRTIRPRRKMGHVTFLAEQPGAARDRAVRFHQSLVRARQT